jgi:hypothetical protein
MPKSKGIGLESASPVVRDLFAIAEEQKLTYQEWGRLAGVAFTTIHAWTRYTNPSLMNIEACAGVLGYEVRLVKVEGDEL